MRRWAAVLVLMGLALLPRLAIAAPTPDSAYRGRAEQLLKVLGAPGGEKDFFSTLFLDAVPLEQWRALADDLRKEHGRPLRSVL